MSKRDVARMWVQEITGGRKPRLCIEKGEDNLVVVATFESTNHSKYFEEIIHEMCEELKQYRAIGTVSEFRELMEKATAYRYCPTCNAFVCDPRNESSCGDCQTFIDWSEGKG